uniref:Uncharacterized protein n=1 Tax=viral metagenome TaxID=1070528 RepID=A0A6C0ACD5_9ZZZZ
MNKNVNKNNRTNRTVVNALEYYDKNMERNFKTFNKAKYLSFPKEDSDIKGDIVRTKINLYNNEKKKIFDSKFEIIGIYENQTKTWSWAWSIPKLPKNKTYTSRKILNYGLDLESDNVESSFLRAELITGRFRISNLIQLDLHVSVASYISKIPNIYKYIFKQKTSDSDLIEIDDSLDDSNYSIYYLFLLD